MRTATVFFFAAVLARCEASVAAAQPPSPGTVPYTVYGEPPVMDNPTFYHLLFNQLEGAPTGQTTSFAGTARAGLAPI